jgi:hypothetical protein
VRGFGGVLLHAAQAMSRVKGGLPSIDCEAHRRYKGGQRLGASAA